jgi:predicted hydrocarbon binding protein
MSMQSSIITTMKDAGIDDPLTKLMDLAKKMTVADICEMFGFERSVLENFLYRRKIACVTKKPYLRDIIGDDIDTILPELGKTMTCEQIAEKYGVAPKKISNYMGDKGHKAIKIRKTKNDDEFGVVKVFLCSDCKKPNSLTLMSAKKDVCQRCLKNQIRGRV